MKDAGHDETNKVLDEIEKRIAKEYKQAEKEVAVKLGEYLRKFEIKDELKKRALENGLITEDEYKQWRIGQVMIGKRWAEMRDTLAQDFTNASQIAKSIAFDHMPEVYAINHDYGTFQVEKASLLDTSYTLYDRQALEELVKNEDKFIPAPGRKVTRAINEGKQLAWDRKQVQSVMMQGLLQGESIPKLATRLANVVGESDRKAAVRNARTMTTGVQNAGRIASYDRANKMGIETKKQWLAALDSRTRHWHAALDGEVVDNDKPFENEFGKIMYPGDPSADPANIYNCRCTLIASIKGFERDVSDMGLRRDDKLGDMSYDEWKKGHYETKSDSITKQDEIAETMRNVYGAEYKKYKGIDDENDLKMGARSDNIQVSEVHIFRSDEIDGFNSTEQITEMFPQVLFSESFSDMKLESQKEVAQGLRFMSDTYGKDILPKQIIVAADLGGDMARYNVTTRIMKFKRDIEPGMALVAVCHESIHALDAARGGISESVIKEAYKRLGVRRNSKDASKLLYKSIGARYIEYKDNLQEQLAWSYESSLYSTNDKFGNTIHTIIDERFGKEHGR